MQNVNSTHGRVSNHETMCLHRSPKEQIDKILKWNLYKYSYGKFTLIMQNKFRTKIDKYTNKK